MKLQNCILINFERMHGRTDGKLGHKNQEILFWIWGVRCCQILV